MKILPVVQTFNPESKAGKPVFGAKVNKKVVTDVAGGIFKELSGAVQADDLAKKIQAQITNPKQKNIFFATVASLITATAAQLTGILTGETPAENTSDIIETKKAAKKVSQRVKNSDGDVYEPAVKNAHSEETKLNLSRHKGNAAKFETDLAATMNQISKSMKLQESDNAKLVEIYNKFCGANYKGEHYSPENELRQNKDIAQSLNEELMQCGTAEDLKNVVFRYNQYSLEPDKTDSETIKIIKDYDNIKEAYTLITQETNGGEKAAHVESFVKSLNQIPVPKSLKQIWLKTINGFYTDNLSSLAAVYNEINTGAPDLTEKFLSLLNSKQVSGDALQKWHESAYKYYLNFFEYNAMVKNGIDDNTIKEIAKQKRNTKLHEINIKDKDTFVITPPFTYIDRNFYLINNLFQLMQNKDSYTVLNSNEPERCTIDDIKAEITKRGDSYPNLKRHLTSKDKKYFNKGKMQNLVDLYYGDKMNQKLFTMHSYLRFIERVVIPAIDGLGGLEDSNYCKTVNKTYIAKVKELRQILQESFKHPVEIWTYKIGDVKAPQFAIPMTNSDGDNLIVTINNDNKIHTIF